MKKQALTFFMLFILLGIQNPVQAATKVYPGGQAIGIYVQSEEYDVLDNGEKVYKNCQGIGTLTYTTENDYVALGHGIYDEKGDLFPVTQGDVYESTLISIVKGKRGTPGELIGNMEYNPSCYMGTINKNTVHGIYGKLNHTYSSEEKKEKAIPIATNYSQIHKGDALIRSCISGEPKDYHIQILKTNAEMESEDKGMIIRITDKELLKQTGGIVQGMSGTPILQDGRLIGAITHVFVQDPTKGYAIYSMNLNK